MLQAMRSGAHSHIIKFVLFGLLVMDVAGLVLMDVGGYFRGGVASTDVAKIGRETISIRHFDRTVSQILRQQGLDPQTAYRVGYIHQILMSEAQDRLLRREAQKFGIYVSDKEVAAQKMTNQILQQAILAGARVIPDPLVRDLYAFSNEVRQVEYFAVANADAKDIDEPTDEDLELFYQAVMESYAIPERRSFTVALIDAEDVESSIGISEEELKAMYEESLAYFEKPETRSIAQAIVGAHADALAIQEKADAGTPLETAVKDVTGSTDGYVESQSFERGGLPDDVADAAFSAGEGDILGPLETPLGWHVLEIVGITSPSVTPFEEVKEELGKERLQTLLADQMFEQANLVDDMIAGGAPLEDAIEEYGLETTVIAETDASGKDASGNDALSGFANDRDKILETGFSLTEGEVAPVLELSDGRFIFIRADKVAPRNYPSPEDVRKDLTEKWRERERRLAAASKADAALVSLEAGKSLEEVAGSFGAKVRTASVPRTGDSESLTPQVRARFFDVPIGTAAMAPSKDGFILGRVTAIDLLEPDESETEQLDALEQNLARQLPNEILTALVGKLAEDYKLKVNEDLLRRTYGGEGETE
ncbi:MAG: hypothetical protein EOM26_05095 [Alphaproteobacteria bacterium]|nr:hypothetical protein [Alphaproteobacteria bacterium]